MVTEAILVSAAVVTIAVAAVSLALHNKAGVELKAIAATITTQVESYKKSIATHLDILEATGSEEIKKIVADIRAKL
jgi:hypothetical protein